MSFLLFLFLNTVNKHKPWLEPTYHGLVTESDSTVLLDPPLIALDKDAPLRFAGTSVSSFTPHELGLVGSISHIPFGLFLSLSENVLIAKGCVWPPCTIFFPSNFKSWGT